MKLLCTLSLLVCLLTPKALCWGEIGHRTVGYLAQMYFDRDGAALFNELIEPNPDFDISDGANWADGKKFKWPFTKPWHYIDAKDNPPKSCKVNYKSDCPVDDGCIIRAIKNMTSRVNDASLDKEQQSDALKFLLHFIGDIHQPLHTEDKCNGGNQILVHFGSASEVKLHQVWDKDIIHKLLQYKRPRGPDPDNVYDKSLAAAWAEQLHQSSARARMTAECTDVTKPEKCALKWATDANIFVCSYVLKDGRNTGKDVGDHCEWDWQGPADLAGDYYEGAVPIVEELVAKAGMRLGAWINGLAAERAAMTETSGAGAEFRIQGSEWEL